MASSVGDSKLNNSPPSLSKFHMIFLLSSFTEAKNAITLRPRLKKAFGTVGAVPKRVKFDLHLSPGLEWTAHRQELGNL